MIKMIATDMDGTFLRDDKTYDYERFVKLLEELERRDIKFVIASGNQYRQLRLNFPEFDSRLTYVAENGSHIVDKSETIIEQFIERQTALDLIDYIQQSYPQALITLAGKVSSYMLKSADPEKVAILRQYLPKLTFLDSYSLLPADHIFKITLLVKEEQTQEVMDKIAEIFAQDQLTGTSSGFGCIDVITTGMHKGWGLSYLLDYWKLTPENLMAFGDGGNDIEMLKLASASYVMDNAPAPIKNYGQPAPSNNEDGVLEVIENYLQNLS
ncbi:Cof-type HAD-IIB family hydrolase [Streptococcus dentapri]|uniref:Cof-type HAD-IIB family hydrolase n=1 Tax=Streptococcus dentapri TaxID=573564 RepID=A0ABV8D1W8_9STRE